MTVDREFFLSFTGADRPWAEWLLAELDAAGYSSVSQLRDFVAGASFVRDMDRAARRAKWTLGVLSPQALQAPYVQQEWDQRLASDPTITLAHRSSIPTPVSWALLGPGWRRGRARPG